MMFTIGRLLSFSICLALLLTAPLQAEASVSFELNDVYSGSSPLGPAPWLGAVFSDLSPGHVRLTLTAQDLERGEYVSAWYFNLNPALNASNLTFSYVSGIHPTEFTKRQDRITVDGIHGFDFKISDPAWGNTFGAGDTTVIDIGGINGLTAADFDALLSFHGGSYLAAAHIENIPEYNRWHSLCGYGDAIVGAEAVDPPAATPEPSTVMLIGLGLGLAAVARKRFS